MLLRLATLETDTGHAAALFESARRANPNRTTALVNLGTLYARSGRIAEAAALWERMLTTDPAIEGAVLNLAQVRPRAEARRMLGGDIIFWDSVNADE